MRDQNKRVFRAKIANRELLSRRTLSDAWEIWLPTRSTERRWPGSRKTARWLGSSRSSNGRSSLPEPRCRVERRHKRMVAGKIGAVERQNLRNAVRRHQSNHSRVVDLNALHGVSHHEHSPQGVGPERFAQHRKQSLKDTHPPVCLLDRKAISSPS